MINQFCGCIANNCDDCFTMSIPYCPPQYITIPTTNLMPYYTIYYLWIRDKFDNIWTDTVFGNADGTFDINTANFPQGMFSPEFGSIDLYLSVDDLGTIVQLLNLYGYEPYNCIILSVDEPVYLTTDDGCTYLTDDEGNLLLAQ